MKHILCLFFACSIFFQGINIAYAQPVSLDIQAKSSVLMEASTGELLYENNKDEKLPIASVTKIMTMLLIMESVDSGKISLNDMVTASEVAKSMGGSTMFLETGEQLSVNDMLKGIAVASANDGAVAMAEHIAGSVEGFVELMNTRAKELGMINTHFVNTNGLDDDNHYSTAYDVALMSRELIKHEKIFEYTTIWMDTLRDGKFQLANTNKLIRFYRGANGLKTGSTSKAKCCLSATAKRDDMQLIAVVLAAPTSKDRFAAASKLLDHGFANYAVKKQVEAGEIVTQVAVNKGTVDMVNAVASEQKCNLLKKGDNPEIEKRVIMNESIFAPVQKGQELGRLELYQGGSVISSVTLVAEEDVAKKGLGDCVRDIMDIWVHG